MIYIKSIFIIISCVLLAHCRNVDKNKWSIIEINLPEGKLDLIAGFETIAPDRSVKIRDYEIEFSNFVEDSRSTAVDYDVWKKQAYKTPASDLEIAEKISYFGKSSKIFHFSEENANKGFLIFGNNKPEKVWVELWNHSGITRVRADFVGKLPDPTESEQICNYLAQLRWRK